MLPRLLAACVVLLLPLTVPGTAVATSHPTGCDDTDLNPQNTEWIDADYTFTFSSLTSVTVSARLGIHKLDLGSMGTMHADGIRYAYEHGDASQVQAIRDSVAAAFNKGVEAAFPDATLGPASTAEVDATTLGHAFGGSCFGPGVAYDLSRNVTLDFADMAGPSAEKSDATTAFRVGARLDATFNLQTPRGHNATYTFVLPTLPGTTHAPQALPLVLAAAPQAPVTAVAGTDNQARVRAEAWQSTTDIPSTVVLPLAGRDVRVFNDDESSVELTVDFKDIITSVGDLAERKLPVIDMGIETAARISVVELPESLSGRLQASRLTLTHVDSYGLRLLRAEGLLNQSTIDTLERELLARINDKAKDFAGGSASATGGFGADTWSLSQGTAPLVYGANASFMLDADKMGGAGSGVAFTLYSFPFSLPLSPLEGQLTTYRVFLPEGIALVDASYDKGTVTKVMRGDREGFQVDSTETGNVNMTFGVTAFFVWSKFMGVVIGVGAVLLLILVGILALVVKIVRRFTK